MEEEDIAVEETPQERKQRNWWLIIALVAAVAAGVLLASTVWQSPWAENTVGEAAAEDRKPDPQAWCAAQSTYDSIRSELFRRAAQVRGSDEQAYTRLSDFALLRVSGPIVRGVDEDLNSVTCNGTAHLDLPPGVAVAGGRRSLSGDIDYMVQPAADRTGNVVRLGNADSIVVPLATLSRAGLPQSAPLVPPDLQNQVVEPPPFGAQEQEQEAQPQEPEESAPQGMANPSFDCGRARTRGEIAVCGDPGLAALDRQMAGQFNQALRQADRSQRRLLERTRGRFLSYRDRCATNQCVAETYRSRMREISDIMAGRWRG